jgi:hypothetical protein
VRSRPAAVIDLDSDLHPANGPPAPAHTKMPLGTGLDSDGMIAAELGEGELLHRASVKAIRQARVANSPTLPLDADRRLLPPRQRLPRYIGHRPTDLFECQFDFGLPRQDDGCFSVNHCATFAPGRLMSGLVGKLCLHN